MLVVCFSFFIYPISSEGGISINYSFVFLPLCLILVSGKLQKVPPNFLLPMALFGLIFCLTSLFQLDEEPLRRIQSFAVFMAAFSYVFVKIDTGMVQAFKVAVVGMGLFLSIKSLYVFLVLGVNLSSFGAKSLVGSSRLGFIYLMGIWLTSFLEVSKGRYRLLKYLILWTLGAGLLLTFSRASIAALAGSLALFAIVGGAKWLARPNLQRVRRAVLAATSAGLLLLLLNMVVPLTFDFYQERIVTLVFDQDLMAAGVENPADSVGTRLVILEEILDFVKGHPLTGSGYLGVWILPEIQQIAGSAHNQYLDVLFRTGVLGLLAYVWLLLSLFAYLRHKEPALFWGLVGVAIYGLFQETFKESQGAFLLAFLWGMLAQSLRSPSRIQLQGTTVGAS